MLSNRVRLQSSRGWKERVCSICEQLQLSKWFPNPERECVNGSTIPSRIGLTWASLPVCVSSLMVDEIKRIIKTSEIMKYVSCNPRALLFAYSWTGKMTVNGHRRIRMAGRSWRFGWVASIFPLRCEWKYSFPRAHVLNDFDRPPRLARSSMLQNRKTQKVCVSFTTLFKILKH